VRENQQHRARKSENSATRASLQALASSVPGLQCL
jgi:hypothetical protein